MENHLNEETYCAEKRQQTFKFMVQKGKRSKHYPATKFTCIWLLGNNFTDY